MAKRRRRQRSIGRYVFDSCHGSAAQVWERVSVNWLVVVWVAVFLILSFVIFDRLQSVPPRYLFFEREIQKLEHQPSPPS